MQSTENFDIIIGVFVHNAGIILIASISIFFIPSIAI